MSLLLLLSLAIAIAGLHNVLEQYQWWGPPFGVMLVVFVVAAVVRFYVGRRWAGTAAGLVAGIMIVTLFFASNASFFAVIPTGDTIDRFTALVLAGNQSIAQQSLPAIATSGIEFMLCAAVAAIAVFMDAAANWWRAPALVGVPLLIIVVIPSIIIPSLADGVTFILTAIVFLFIVISRGRRPQPALAATAGIIAVIGALIAPLALPSVAPGGPTGTGIGTLSENINPIINLGQDLRRTDPTPVLSYSTTESTGEYLQLTTLDNFRGQEWVPDTPALKPSHTVTSVGAAPGLGAAIDVAGVSTKITIDDAHSAWLPVPYPEQRVTGLEGNWLWEDANLSIRSADASTPNQTYAVSSLDVEPTQQQLEKAPRSPTNPLAKVPTGLSPIVAATARKVVGNAKTDFDKAIALQSWFRNGTFRYSTKAPAANNYDGSSLDIIVPFLKAKAGYCVHFATTMAIMARTLGIPARVAVGFLPGQLTHPKNGTAGVYQVTSSDMHAWPELYFKGIGWVRFEPTPSKGFEPNFPAAPTGTSSSAPTDPSSSAPTDTKTTPTKAPVLPRTGANDSTSTALGQNRLSPTVGYGGLGILFVLLLAAVPALVRIGIRRRRLTDIRRGIDSAGWAWQELRESVRDLGLDGSSALTPAQLAAVLASRFTAQHHARARAALSQLLRLVENEAYGRTDQEPPIVASGSGSGIGVGIGIGVEIGIGGGSGSRDTTGEEMAEQLQTVLRGLRRSCTRSARFTATLTPPTLFERIFGRRAAASS